MGTEFDQSQMLHRLPKAQLVNRLDYLVEAARGRRVIHVGFVDEGCVAMQHAHGTWLHERLSAAALSLVGLDVSTDGVEQARAAGYEAYALDCGDPVAVAQLGLEPADLVIAGEVIEHVENPGGFLAGLRSLVRPDGEVIVTTPNASGWFNSVAATINKEVNHPDHIVMFSFRTLSTLMARHGLEVVRAATFVPEIKNHSGSQSGAAVAAARAVAFLERQVARWAGFVADGMILVARPVTEPSATE